MLKRWYMYMCIIVGRNNYVHIVEAHEKIHKPMHDPSSMRCFTLFHMKYVQLIWHTTFIIHKCKMTSFIIQGAYIVHIMLIISICSTMCRHIKGAAGAINAIWRTTVLQFPVVGKYRTVAGFAQSDILSLNK